MNQILFTVLCLTIVSGSIQAQQKPRGIDAKEGEFKYHAIVSYISPYFPDSLVSCGGAIINEWYILTSASCVKKYAENLDQLVLFFGTTNIKRKQQERKPADIINPKQFNVSEHHDDIALIRTTEKIEFSDNVQPINLPLSAEVFEGTLVSSGFGIRIVS